MDSIHASDGRMHISHAQHSMHTQSVQDQEHHDLHYMSNGNGLADEHENEGHGIMVVEREVQSDHGDLAENRGVMVDRGGDNCDQLTLSYQGQVYVFDSVSPEKVYSFFFSCLFCRSCIKFKNGLENFSSDILMLHNLLPFRALFVVVDTENIVESDWSSIVLV